VKEKILFGLFLFFLFVVLGEAGYYYYLTRYAPKNFVKETPTQPTGITSKESVSLPKDSLPIVLVNEHPEYLMEINPLFDLGQQRSLLTQYGKSKITFHLVGSEDQVPLDGATQRGREFEVKGGKTIPMNMMMAIYKDNSVEYYLYPYPENYQELGERKLKVLSGVVSYKLIEALAAQDRGYLVEAKLAPKIPMEEIKKYCMDNPLIIVKER
jgi:hypothetical protein